MASYNTIASWEPCNIGTCMTCRTANPGTTWAYMTGSFANSGKNLAADCFPNLKVHQCGDTITIATVSCRCSGVMPPGTNVSPPIVDNGPASPCSNVTSPCSTTSMPHLVDMTKASFMQLAPVSLGLIPVLVTE